MSKRTVKWTRQTAIRQPVFVKGGINVGDAVQYIDEDNSENVIAIVVDKVGEDYSFKCYGDNEMFWVGKQYLTKIG